MYDTILVPTDGSPGMAEVIAHAADLARAYDATLHGIYVVDTAALADLPMGSTGETVHNALRNEAATALDDLEAHAEGLTVQRAIVEGSPAREIVAYAEESGIDLVVMGTHGRSGLDRVLLGSVAERVVRTSPVPVLTVRVSASN